MTLCVIIIITLSYFIILVGDHDEEYSVVLMQPQCVVDLSAPWAVIFAVCCRNPNCINVCSECNWYLSIATQIDLNIVYPISSH